jgi:hypothetical protein
MLDHSCQVRRNHQQRDSSAMLQRTTNNQIIFRCDNATCVVKGGVTFEVDATCVEEAWPTAMRIGRTKKKPGLDQHLCPRCWRKPSFNDDVV